MSESTFIFFLVVVQIVLICCCFLFIKSHCGIACAIIRTIYRTISRSNDSDTSNIAESGYAKAASPVPPPRQPQVSSEQHQPLVVVPQNAMPQHFQPYQVYQPQQLAPCLPMNALPYPPASYPHQIGFVSCDSWPYVRKSPSMVTAPADGSEKNQSDKSQPHDSTSPVKQT